MPFAETLVEMLQSGASSLASYLAAHVLLCLVPAFFISPREPNAVGDVTVYIQPGECNPGRR